MPSARNNAIEFARNARQRPVELLEILRLDRRHHEAEELSIGSDEFMGEIDRPVACARIARRRAQHRRQLQARGQGPEIALT